MFGTGKRVRPSVVVRTLRLVVAAAFMAVKLTGDAVPRRGVVDAERQRAAAAHSRLPLSFAANPGQSDLFRSRGPVVLTALLAFAAALIGAIPARASSSDFVEQVDPGVHTAIAGAVNSPFCHHVNGVPLLICYSPSDIRTAYGFPSGLDGSGQTITIVAAYGSPTIQSDLATFDTKFGLRTPPSFTIDCSAGCPTFNPNQQGPPSGSSELVWAAETTLDVEWTHALAPGAAIVLVVAPSTLGSGLNNAVAAAIQNYPGAIISQSFGSNESAIGGQGNNIQLQQARQNFKAAAAAGDTAVAGSGDSGATGGGSSETAFYPASDPLVTAVGGTEGYPYFNGFTGSPIPTCRVNRPCNLGLAVVRCGDAGICTTVGYGGEQVWNEPPFDGAPALAGGGAESLIFPAPAFQAGVNGSSRRTTPDVAFDAASSGGVLTYDSFPGMDPGYYVYGGTSIATPQWAAIIALADQARARLGKPALGYLNDTLYRIAESKRYSSDFHDITIGTNQLLGTPFGYSATPGYDTATGWGTPQVANLVADLASS
jgi:subtilase family serine protease